MEAGAETSTATLGAVEGDTEAAVDGEVMAEAVGTA